MDFGYDADQQALVAEVDRVLDAAGPETPAQKLFALLGDRQLLAVHWPVEYGGRGMKLKDHVAVAERVGLRGLADEIHLVTVQGVGCTLLTAGSKQQREKYLPPIAAGRSFASLMLSETAAGTDLAALQTRAEDCGDVWNVTGEKVWNLHADWSDFGLCSARTRDEATRYDGITLLLVPLDAPGVSLAPLPRAVGTPYWRVTLDDVKVGKDAVVGREGGAWSLLSQAISYERAGLDYLTRAQRWLRAAERLVRGLPDPERERSLEGLLRAERDIVLARALAYHAAKTADGVQMHELCTAYSKFAAAEAAQGVAWWAAETLSALFDDPTVSEEALVLRRAVSEAPELSVSGGASELQLDLIAMEQRTGEAGP